MSEQKSGGQSAKEATPGGAIGLVVGYILAQIAKRYGLDLPNGAADAIVGGFGAVGAVASSWILGNRRPPAPP